MYITIPLHWLYINIDELSRVDIMKKSVSSNLGLFNPYKHSTLLVSLYLRNDLRSICHKEKHNYKTSLFVECPDLAKIHDIDIYDDHEYC